MRRVAWLAFLFAAPCRAQGRGGDSLYPPDRLTVRPAVVAMPTFHYPPELHGHRPHGHIVVRLVLDTAGHVEPSSITILETPDSVLDAATRAFAAAVLFRPAEARGRRVRVEVDLPIDVQAPDTSNRPLPLGAVEQKPALLSHPHLAYPPEEVDAGREGVVLIEGVLDTLGRFEDSTLRVMSTPGPAFSAEALRVLRASRFRPARVGDHAVRVLIQQPFNFSIPSLGRCHRKDPVPQPLPQAADLGPLPDGVRLIADLDQPPALVSHPRVNYPPTRRQNGIEASVLVAVIVDTVGQPEPASIRVVGTPDSAFVGEAVRVVRGSRFTAGRLHGNPVRTMMIMPVHFEILCP